MIKQEAIRLPFSYAAGKVGGEYLNALQQQRFLAARCQECARVVSPARSLCPYCGTATAEQLVEVGPDGEVASWTELPKRGRYVLVRLDGADTATLHRLVGDTQPTIGARARSRFADGELTGFEAVAP